MICRSSLKIAWKMLISKEILCFYCFYQPCYYASALSPTPIEPPPRSAVPPTIVSSYYEQIYQKPYSFRCHNSPTPHTPSFTGFAILIVASTICLDLSKTDIFRQVKDVTSRRCDNVGIDTGGILCVIILLLGLDRNIIICLQVNRLTAELAPILILYLMATVSSATLGSFFFQMIFRISRRALLLREEISARFHRFNHGFGRRCPAEIV
jgi:hypothetical protein